MKRGLYPHSKYLKKSIYKQLEHFRFYDVLAEENFNPGKSRKIIIIKYMNYKIIIQVQIKKHDKINQNKRNKIYIQFVK